MNFPKHKTVIIVCGPTAAGKTSLAISLAKYFQTEIISADSRQCFKELNIGVARPSENELMEVKHHFIASHSVKDEIDAAIYEKFALHKVKELFKKHDVVIIAGGTGLYIKSFCEGLDEIPSIENQIRERIKLSYEKKGLGWLQKEVQEKDPDFFERGEIQNPQRLMRALEVTEATGKSILSYRTSKKAKRDFNIIKIGLELPKEELYRNINNRVESMIGVGFVEEVKSLLPYKELNALQTVGYKEMYKYINEQYSLFQAAEEIKKNTRHYAKRQMTWFKKDKEIKWFSPSDPDEVRLYLDKVLTN